MQSVLLVDVAVVAAVFVMVNAQPNALIVDSASVLLGMASERLETFVEVFE